MEQPRSGFPELRPADGGVFLTAGSGHLNLTLVPRCPMRGLIGKAAREPAVQGPSPPSFPLSRISNWLKDTLTEGHTLHPGLMAVNPQPSVMYYTLAKIKTNANRTLKSKTIFS